MTGQIWRAIAGDDWPAVRRLLDGLPLGGLTGPDATEMLRAAVRAGEAEVAETMVMLGADPFAPWPDGGNAIVWATARGDAETVRNLLAAREARADETRARGP